jgi:hypothetical protein
MDINRIKLYSERTNLRTFVLAIIVAFLGFILLYFSFSGYLKGVEVWQTVVENVGSFFLIAGLIAFLWELWVKRAFLDEILAKVQMADEVKQAGFVRVTDTFHRGIDWEQLFRSVRKLDIFFAYGHTWRSTHSEELKAVATRKDARIRVVLPDYEDAQTVSELARQFNYSPEKLKSLIREAEKDFKDLRHINANNGAQIDIWLLPSVPHFSFYRFDHLAIIALNSHSRERVPVPTFVVEMGGTLYDYIRKEFEAMIKKDGLARIVPSKE